MNRRFTKCGHTGKVCFKSHQHAMHRAMTILSNMAGNGQFRAYECQWCGLWHLTSK